MNILLIVTNVGQYASGQLKTGLWLSELTHIYHSAQEQGFAITLASPKGGTVPLDPESLKPLVLDSLSKGYLENPQFMNVLRVYGSPHLSTRFLFLYQPNLTASSSNYSGDIGQ